MKTIKKHTVKKEINEIIRASDYILENCNFFKTKSSIKKAIKNKRIKINGKICNTGTHIKKGQIIELLEKQQTKTKIFPLKLKIIFEDDFIALINKPAGINVSGNKYKTIQNALPYNLKPSKSEDALPRPLPVHRLDNQTSGLLLIAKTLNARINLGKQFENKKIKKKYAAVVTGTPPEKATINLPINAKPAVTKFELVKTEKSLRNGQLSLLYLYPETGRTHQLRIHCQKAGFPILGDKLYSGNLPVLKGKGMFLSAVELSFRHPENNKKMQFKIPVPEKFHKIIEREKQRYIFHKKK